MYCVYVYDLKTELVKADKVNYNTAKRRFYSSLNKLFETSIIIKTDSESMLIVSNEYEIELDLFFSKFKRWITAYKIRTNEIYELN